MIISAMKQAIDVLEILPEHGGNAFTRAADALRQAIDEAKKQEPVAWWDGKESVVFAHDTIDTPNWTDYWTTPLYKDPTPCKTCEALARTVMMDQTSHDTAPPKREWVGLTDEAIWLEYQHLWSFHPAEEPTLAKDIVKFAKAIEAKLKEKNT